VQLYLNKTGFAEATVEDDIGAPPLHRDSVGITVGTLPFLLHLEASSKCLEHEPAGQDPAWRNAEIYYVIIKSGTSDIYS
jgi:hypothetical protein